MKSGCPAFTSWPFLNSTETIAPETRGITVTFWMASKRPMKSSQSMIFLTIG